jgi:hypothetical protein
VKIGSAIDIDKRLNSYQTACPHRAYRLEASAFVEDRRRVEQELMLALQTYKHQHEWFRIDIDVVARMLSSLQRKRHA